MSAFVRVLFVDPDGNCELITGNFKKRKGVYLTYEEIRLFELIHVCRYLPSNLIHKFFQKLDEKPRKSEYISIRLKRFVEMKILYRKTRILDNGSVQYFYMLKEIGFKILNFMELTDSVWSDGKSKALYRNERYSMHNLTALPIVVDLFLKFYEREGLFNDLKLTRGSKHPMFTEWNETEGLIIKEGIIPDYVFEYENCIICFEHDMKTESLQKIQRKNVMYQRIAEKGLYGNKLYIVYGIIDNNENSSSLKGLKRVHSILAKIPPRNKWANGLHYFVMSNRFSTNLLVDLLTDNQRINETWQQKLMQESLKQLQDITKHKKIHMKLIDKNLLIHNKLHSHLWKAIDFCIQLCIPGKAARTFAFITMQYGCVESFQKAQLIYAQVYERNYADTRDSYTPIELLVGVKNTWEADVLLPFEPNIPIHVLALEEWEEQSNEYLVYSKTSIYKKEKRVLI